MKRFRIMRAAAALVSGAMILQLPGCSDVTFLDVVQTVLLGITAAGALVIIDNL